MRSLIKVTRKDDDWGCFVTVPLDHKAHPIFMMKKL